jgi:UDP-3-O-[3-hydroxymyristoyl] glucosamine N-acyltransferase
MIHEEFRQANDEDTSLDVLEKLSSHKELEIRKSVAINRGSSDEILKKLINDKEEIVRNSVWRHPTSIVSRKALIGKNVKIGQFTTVYDHVEILDNTIIQGYCEIGVSSDLAIKKNVVLGEDSLIRSGTVIYEGVYSKSKLVTGHKVTIRENTEIGHNLQVGTLSDIQGDCIIGDYVRMHSNVHIGKKSLINNFVWIFPYVVLTNDPHPPSEVMNGVVLEEYSVICTMSVVLPGVTIKKGCLVGAGSAINCRTEEHMLYSGNPSRKICPTSKIRLKDGTKRRAYPWIDHFKRGYPHEVVEKLK